MTGHEQDAESTLADRLYKAYGFTFWRLVRQETGEYRMERHLTVYPASRLIEVHGRG